MFFGLLRPAQFWYLRFSEVFDQTSHLPFTSEQQLLVDLKVNTRECNNCSESLLPPSSGYLCHGCQGWFCFRCIVQELNFVDMCVFCAGSDSEEVDVIEIRENVNLLP